MKHMGKHFVKILHDQGLTPTEFGKKAGWTRQHVYELSQSANWMASTTIRVAKILGVQPADLLPL